jgi:hypothetical protein
MQAYIICRGANLLAPAAIERLRPDMAALFATADPAEGVQSFIERHQARFRGQ